jgi:hypothetical protein
MACLDMRGPSRVGWVKRSADPTQDGNADAALGLPPAFAGVDPTYDFFAIEVNQELKACFQLRRMW